MQKNSLVYINRNIILNYLTRIYWILVWSHEDSLTKKGMQRNLFHNAVQRCDTKSFGNFPKLQLVLQTLEKNV